MGQFNLDFAFLAVGSLCKDIEDELCAVNHFHLGLVGDRSALGGIKLKVSESDYEKALKLLKDVPGYTPESIEDSEETDEERCPMCGSTDIRDEIFRLKPLLFSILLFGFPIPFLKGKKRCRSCNNEWKKEEVEEYG